MVEENGGMITGERGMVGMGVMWRVDGKQWVGDVDGGSEGKRQRVAGADIFCGESGRRVIRDRLGSQGHLSR